MIEITDKLFGYIANKLDLTPDVINKYKNSLIFIGDEKQIYQPLTNTYIGVGYTALQGKQDLLEFNTNYDPEDNKVATVADLTTITFRTW